MNNPKVSVIVPCYNVEKFLDRFIDSVLKCSYTNKELIMVNDGSTDGTLEIIKKASERNECIKVVDKPNGGVSSARNAGLDIASGEYVMFPDPDDYVLQDYISAPLELIHDGGYDMVLFGFRANWSQDNSSEIYPIEDYDLKSKQEILDRFFPRFLGLNMQYFGNYLRGGDL